MFISVYILFFKSYYIFLHMYRSATFSVASNLLQLSYTAWKFSDALDIFCSVTFQKT